MKNRSLFLILNLFVFLHLLSCNISRKDGVSEDVEVSNTSSATTESSVMDIVGVSPNGDSVYLSKIKSKIILVEFWASWCPPCRQFNPGLVEIYKKFQGQGFEILSISLDHDPIKWRNAIEKDGLIWRNHISDLKGWESAYALKYGIESIPDNFLIDSTGKILATSLDHDMLEKAVQSYLK